MGLIAFPFIMCFIASPFVIIGVIAYMWHCDYKEKRQRELWNKEYEASSYVSRRLDDWFHYEIKRGRNHYLPDDEWEKKVDEYMEAAKKKYGVTPMRPGFSRPHF